MMLVAYKDCGCRVMALLDADDPEAAAEFVTEAEGLVVKSEDCDRIGAYFCDAHQVGDPDPCADGDCGSCFPPEGDQ